MSDLFKLYISLGISGTGITFIYIFLRLIFNRYTSKSLQYYIWLIPIVRFICPLTFSGSILSVWGKYINEIAIKKETIRYGSRPIIAGNVIIGNRATISGLLILGIIWLVIALLLLIRKITVYQSFLKYLKAGWKEVEDPSILDVLGEVCEDIGVRRSINLCINPLISSPILLGLFHPVIVIPEIPQRTSELKYMLRHEAYHCKYNDIIYIWMMQITKCIHWYNPLIYWLEKQLNQDRELSCDEHVIRHLTEKERFLYGEVLLSSLNFSGSYHEHSVSLSLSESATVLKKRLSAIKSYKKITHKMNFAIWGCGVFLIYLSLLLGGYSSAYKENNLPARPIEKTYNVRPRS